MLIKYHLSREVALCLKLYFFDLHPPGAIEIDSAVNEHLLLRTFHWMHLPEQHTRLVHVHTGFGFWLKELYQEWKQRLSVCLLPSFGCSPSVLFLSGSYSMLSILRFLPAYCNTAVLQPFKHNKKEHIQFFIPQTSSCIKYKLDLYQLCFTPHYCQF